MFYKIGIMGLDMKFFDTDLFLPHLKVWIKKQKFIYVELEGLDTCKEDIAIVWSTNFFSTK